MESKEKLLTLDEVCEILNVRNSYIYKLTSRNQIPYYRIGGLKFRLEEVEEWIAKNRIGTSRTKTFDELVK